MQFISDNMLGKLAKWLRFMGYDTLYPKNMDDKELIKISRDEGRLLLTRDKELAKVKGLDVLYINSDNLDHQLQQVIKDLNLKANDLQLTRCPECNYLLKYIDKVLLAGKVPDGVLKRQDIFWVCKNCEHYYWRGTHYQKIKAKLDELGKKTA
jgi:uncharacterized protein with PIN domain